jgi:hypothetical protein
MNLGGTLIVRNAIEFDFCVEAAVRSLLGVCDQVVVVDGYSDDGTWEWLSEFQPNVTKLAVHQEDWNPSPLGTWLADLTNKARLRLTTPMQLNLQADECLSEEDYPLIRHLASTGQTYTLERLNFWLDHRHILPPNEKVGSTIVRLAPTSLPCVGDAQGLEHTRGWTRSQAHIFHYGFIRDPRKLAAKARPMQQAFFNTTDPIWDAVEREGLGALGDARHATAVARERLTPYHGTHPKVAHGWLREHGYNV